MSNVTRILSQIEHGDPSAPKQSLPLTDAAERIDKMLGEIFPMGSLNSQLAYLACTSQEAGRVKLCANYEFDNHFSLA